MNCYGVIGVGNIGLRHLRNLRTLFPDARVLAVSASGHSQYADTNELELVSLDELIALRPDFVVVASPASLHFTHAEAVIKQGIPVLVEKPLCASTEQVNQFLELWNHYPDAVIDVAYCLRYLPAAKVVKQTLEQRLLGQTHTVIAQVGQYLPQWRPGKDYRSSVSAQAALGGGALLELSHELDYLQWLFGPLTLCYARNRHSGLLELDVEDISDLVLESQQQISCYLHLDFLQQVPSRHCRIIGANGTLNWDLIANTVVLQQEDNEQVLYQDGSYDRNTMYLDLLKSFWLKAQQRDTSRASVRSAAAVISIIEQSKLQAPMERL